MAHRNKPWPAGTPCWVDLMAVDLDRSQAFYRAVLGWDFTPSEPEFGGYCNALVGERQAAGMSPTVPGMENAPHVWSVYLATDDICATGAAAGAGGAHEIYPPMQVGSFGWMGMWADPTGASFGAWQSIEHTGVTVFDEHGALAWCDLVTGDPAAAQAFYAGVFGYSYEEIGIEGAPYALFTVPGGERPAGGIGALDPSGGSTPGWTVCFGHDDVDAAAGSVAAAGGRVLREPYDFQFGRLMHAVGPDGEQFSMITALPMG